MQQRFAIGALMLVLPLAAAAAPVNYDVDPVHTFPQFMVSHFGTAFMHGRFNKTSGKLVLDREGKNGTIDITIDTASIDTGPHELAGRPRTRDDHLRTPDFFNVKEFPTLTYKGSTKWTGEWPTEVQGQLTLLGVTHPLKLTVVQFNCVPDPRTKGKGELCGGNATGTFKRSDFGMKFGIPAVGDEIRLQVQFEALRPLP